MNNQGATCCSSLHPWLDGEQRFSEVELVWQDSDHTTPFSAMADLIGNWPGSPQTSEWPLAERHNRLMQVIAGYPEVFAGRRPLDAPLHPRSRLAFKLSLFIDRIAIPTSYEWHSLRTALLLNDTLSKDIKSSGNDREFKTHHRAILYTMMKQLRENTKYIDSNNAVIGYDSLNPHPDEVRFLTLLNSQHHRRRLFWPVDKEIDGVLAFPSFMFPNDKNMAKFNLGSGENDFQEHEFKFRKIQDWINQWAQAPHIPLLGNVSHNLIIGASVMLESTFAKLRSQVIATHSVGALTVDGGGRISYVSQNKPEDEKDWFEEKLGRILLFDNEHPHPFQRTIQESVQDYGIRAERFIRAHVKSYNQDMKDKSKRIDFQSLYHKEDDLKGLPNKSMFEFLLRKQYILNCMPSLEETNDDILIWEKEKCVMCKEKHRLQKHNSPNKLLQNGEYVCVFHYLLYTIGKQAQIRYSSRADVFNQLPHAKTQGTKVVNQIVKFDGNSIGGWFTKPYSYCVKPGPWEGDETEDKPDGQLWSNESNTEIITEFWDQNKDEILNPMTNLDKWDFSQIVLERPSGWEKEGFEIRKGEILRKAMIIRRTQALLRRQRRSFHFNAVWWSALQEHLHQAVPWVLAGDDITLVSSSSEPNVFHTMLTSLHHELEKEFPQTPITFAGGVCSREDNETIRNLYKRCDEVEHSAGNVWKLLFADDERMPVLEEAKRNKLKKWLNDSIRDPEQLRSSAMRYAIGASDGINSLLLHSDWNTDPEREGS